MKIIHIKQMHKLPPEAFDTPEEAAEIDAELFNAVVRSQWRVMQNIKQRIAQHPGCVVINEGDTEDTVYLPDDEKSVFIKNIFPNGLPQELNELNELQCECLYNVGGAQTLLHLGEIQFLGKSIHKKDDEIISAAITLGLWDSIGFEREVKVINCAKEIAEKTGTMLVIIVYGDAHDLKPHCEREGFELETINTLDFESEPINIYEFSQWLSEQSGCVNDEDRFLQNDIYGDEEEEEGEIKDSQFLKDYSFFRLSAPPQAFSCVIGQHRFTRK